MTAVPSSPESVDGVVTRDGRIETPLSVVLMVSGEIDHMRRRLNAIDEDLLRCKMILGQLAGHLQHRSK